MIWTLRASEVSDFAAVWVMVQQAKRRMAAMGIDQWQDGDPDEGAILEAVSGDEGVIVVAPNRKIAGFAVVSFGIEESYENLTSGQWKSDDEYATLHRVVVSENFIGRGVAGRLFDGAKERAKDENVASLRVDTHRDNAPMRRAIECKGFEYCGTCLLLTGEERVVYEKDKL